jgi:hypothetical protein
VLVVDGEEEEGGETDEDFVMVEDVVVDGFVDEYGGLVDDGGTAGDVAFGAAEGMVLPIPTHAMLVSSVLLRKPT